MGLDVTVYKAGKNVKSLGKTHGKKGETQMRIRTGKPVEKISKKYPDHMFTLGYFRSSYNDAGTNNVLDQLTGLSMHDAFKRKVILEDEYEFIPDWEHALKTLKEIHDRLDDSDLFRVTTVSVEGKQDKPKREDEALEIFRAELGDHEDLYSYTSGKGHFYLDDPQEVYAVIPGTDEHWKDEPCVYVVWKMKDADWYMQAVEIMIETCEMVLADPDHTYYLTWWG